MTENQLLPENVAPQVHPLRLHGRPDPVLNRWLWLVKWVLLIPHFLVLVVLWLGVVVVTVIAFFAILFTGRYPDALFDYTLGVLRWSWRVSYYGYSALATDRYPPFSLGAEPDYPATLDLDRPGELSRGLVLVKWWLLAIPHYLIVGAMLGGVSANSGRNDGVSIGLQGAVVLVIGVALLFTGGYPRGLRGVAMGINRWAARVFVYAALLTDVYPPFRFDQADLDHDPEADPFQPAG